MVNDHKNLKFDCNNNYYPHYSNVQSSPQKTNHLRKKNPKIKLVKLLLFRNSPKRKKTYFSKTLVTSKQRLLRINRIK